MSGLFLKLLNMSISASVLIVVVVLTKLVNILERRLAQSDR